MENSKIINKENIEESKYAKSIVNPEILVTFTDDIRWLIESVRDKRFCPRFVIENLQYLDVNSLKEIGIPMKCFCDIRLGQVQNHMEWYGDYGIAMKKSWGITKGLQKINYLCPESDLTKEFSSVLNEIFQHDSENEHEKNLQSYIFNQLIYSKPYSGEAKKINNIYSSEKCFADELEWRYIPDLKSIGISRFLLGEETKAKNEKSNLIKQQDKVALKFEYSDISYILLPDLKAAKKLQNDLENKVDSKDLLEIMTKVLIWKDLKEVI